MKNLYYEQVPGRRMYNVIRQLDMTAFWNHSSRTAHSIYLSVKEQ